MRETFHVRLTKDYLVFSAAHFITFGGNVCERLHGHNYRVCAEVHGPLDENHYVVDFIALRDRLRSICEELDHHMLLPTEHDAIIVTAGEREVEVVYEDRRWVFPRGDCILLPVANTTTELLARHIGQLLLKDLPAISGLPALGLKIAVDENHGQWGVWECRIDDAKA